MPINKSIIKGAQPIRTVGDLKKYIEDLPDNIRIENWILSNDVVLSCALSETTSNSNFEEEGTQKGEKILLIHEAYNPELKDKARWSDFFKTEEGQEFIKQIP